MDESHVSFYEFLSSKELLFHASLDFDLVILDIQMSDLNGYEMARKLREIDRNILLVFCTGKVEPAAEHFKVTPYRYLLKRYTDDEMLKEMAEIVDKMKEQKSYPYILCKYSLGRDRIRVYPESVLYIAIRYGNSQVFACGKLKEHLPNSWRQNTRGERNWAKYIDWCRTFMKTGFHFNSDPASVLINDKVKKVENKYSELIIK